MIDDSIRRSDVIDKLMHIIPYKRYHNGEYILLLNKKECLLAIKAIPSADRWIPCSERLPNEDEIPYDGIERKGERSVSDRILAIDKNGFIRTGYFMNAMDAPRFGKRYEFGEHYQGDPTNWIVGVSCRRFDPIAWMPLPEL